MAINKAFDAPLPGSAMTTRIGDMNMDRPSTFSEPDDALEYTMDKFTSKKGATGLLLALKKDVPVDYLARSLVYKGVVDGLWTPDLAALILQTVMWQICAVAKAKGVSYTYKQPDEEYNRMLEDNIDLLDVIETPKSKDSKAISLFGGL